MLCNYLDVKALLHQNVRHLTLLLNNREAAPARFPMVGNPRFRNGTEGIMNKRFLLSGAFLTVSMYTQFSRAANFSASPKEIYENASKAASIELGISKDKLVSKGIWFQDILAFGDDARVIVPFQFLSNEKDFNDFEIAYVYGTDGSRSLMFVVPPAKTPEKVFYYFTPDELTATFKEGSEESVKSQIAELKRKFPNLEVQYFDLVDALTVKAKGPKELVAVYQVVKNMKDSTAIQVSGEALPEPMRTNEAILLGDPSSSEKVDLNALRTVTKDLHSRSVGFEFGYGRGCTQMHDTDRH
jgi:hypothetical protein